MRRQVVLAFGMALLALIGARSASEAPRSTTTMRSSIVLCEVLPTGRTLTLQVPVVAAPLLERLGAWEGACDFRRAASLEGRVTDTRGRAVAGNCINVVVFSGDDGQAAATTVLTDRLGFYHVWVPFGGSASTIFGDLQDARQFEPYLDVCVNGSGTPVYVPDADNPPIQISEGERLTGVNAVLARYGHIQGKLVDQATGQPLAGVPVAGVRNGDPFGLGEPCATTGPDGTYSVTATPGSWQVDFAPVSSFSCPGPGNSPYFEQWYNGKPDLASADAINVADGQTVSGINAALTRGGSISGRVTDAATGQPISDAGVSVQTVGGDPVGSASVAADGSYTIGPLAAGNYIVAFDDGDGGVDYLGQWYDHAADETTAKPVGVKAGLDSAGIDAALIAAPPPATISGQLTTADTGTLPAHDFPILVYDANGDSARILDSSVDADGVYSVKVPPGDYRVCAKDDGESGSFFGAVTYAPACYPNSSSFSSATLLHAAPGSATGNVNITFQVGGTISGKITDKTSVAPIAKQCLFVYAQNTFFPEEDPEVEVSDANGQYVVGGLPTGNYTVEFGDPFGICTPTGYSTSWYNGKPDQASATPVAVTLGAATSGINAALTPTSP